MKKAVLIAASHGFGTLPDIFPINLLLPPVSGVVALGSYLASQGVPVEIIDVQMDYGIGTTAAAEGVVFRRLARDLLRRAGSIAWVGISQITGANSGLAIAAEIRRVLPRMPIVLGGYFPSFAYRAVLEECPAVTAVVRGDGEAAAIRISRCVEAGKPFLSEETPNLAWREGGLIATNPVAPMDLGELPICDFRLLRDPDAYPMLTLMTSRGCPFRCRFCPEAGMRPFAAYPADWVRRQLAHVASSTKCKRIMFTDPTFGLGTERTRELCKALRSHRFSYAAVSRVDVVGPEEVRLLSEAGFDSVYYGIESASASTLIRMGKAASLAAARRYVQAAARALEACFEEGVTPFMGLMLAFPGDGESDYRATLAFAREMRRRHDRIRPAGGRRAGLIVECFPTMLFDGTALAADLERRFPKTRLDPEKRLGASIVSSPSPGVGQDCTLRYIGEIRKQTAVTPLAAERLGGYWLMSLPMLLEKHPELKDSEGVVKLGDVLNRTAARMSPGKAARLLGAS